MKHIISSTIPNDFDLYNVYNQYVKFMNNDQCLFASHTKDGKLVISESFKTGSMKFNCPHYGDTPLPEILTQNILFWHKRYLEKKN